MEGQAQSLSCVSDSRPTHIPCHPSPYAEDNGRRICFCTCRCPRLSFCHSLWESASAFFVAAALLSLVSPRPDADSVILSVAEGPRRFRLTSIAYPFQPGVQPVLINGGLIVMSGYRAPPDTPAHVIARKKTLAVRAGQNKSANPPSKTAQNPRVNPSPPLQTHKPPVPIDDFSLQTLAYLPPPPTYN
jgi:hypothetical protein